MNTRQIKVLVVDDESDFRQLMAFWLESKGYLILSAADGETGIKLAKENNPDIIFMDLRMPNMDGAETISRIRQFNKEVPIIIISAYTDDPKAIAAMSYGVSGIFYKGTDFKESLSLLEAALRTHKKLKE